MFDQLMTNNVAETLMTPQTLAIRLGTALVLGLLVALIYRVSHGRAKQESPVLFTTLVLLCLLITMVSIVIGDSVARAFSLVGALSIVRFRTVVDDTRDTAFVIFAVVIGMSVGAGLFLMPLVGVPIVAIAAIGLSWLNLGTVAADGGSASSYQLVVRLGLGRDPETVLGASLVKHTLESRLKAASTARQGTAIDLSYAIRLPLNGDLSALVLQLNQLEGVQSVEAREA